MANSNINLRLSTRQLYGFESPAFIIHQATADDLTEISRLHQTVFSVLGETCQTFFQDLQLNPYHLLVAKHPNTPGILGYAAHMNLRPGQHYLAWLGVDPGFFHLGIGSALLRSVIEHAEHEEACELLLDTRECFSKAMQLYFKNGFKLAGTSPSPDGQPAIWLRKSLNNPNARDARYPLSLTHDGVFVPPVNIWQETKRSVSSNLQTK